MSDTPTQNQPSELAMEIFNELKARGLLDDYRHDPIVITSIDAKIAEHEASQWRDASDPPDTERDG